MLNYRRVFGVASTNPQLSADGLTAPSSAAGFATDTFFPIGPDMLR